MTARRDPRREKALDYAHQRRNDYGENDKSSRRNIRRKKRVPHRADRHRTRQTLSGAGGAVVPGLDEAVEERLARKVPKYAGWRLKWPDAELGDWVAGRLERRARLGIDAPATAAARVERITRTRATLRRAGERS